MGRDSPPRFLWWFTTPDPPPPCDICPSVVPLVVHVAVQVTLERRTRLEKGNQGSCGVGTCCIRPSSDLEAFELLRLSRRALLGTLMESYWDFIDYADPSLLRQLVIARTLYPVSKIRSVSFLNRSFGAHFKKDRVHRFLDNLSKSQEEILGSLKEYVTTNYPASFNCILICPLKRSERHLSALRTKVQHLK